ncbi:MAG TPA: alpha/beta fold hydrolase [Solirubrobacteraceae bacterium]|nr:alpha/beta fold hydrolase [Solirubrobacteraceae bacterium]
MRPPRTFTLALLAVATLALTPVGTDAAHALTLTTCPGASKFTCTTLNVPLDRGGRVRGSVELHVQRLQAGAAPSETAVVALAGGPGQAALPLAGELAGAVSPALSGRDLIVFDQRGTGSSGPLECAALEGEGGLATIGQAFERCALQIGARRGSYTTAESVADIESLRQALGYRKLVLFGVSYGTKVALRYAEAHPQDVEAMVLDSVVGPERDDPFQLATFKAMAPALAQLCSARACSGITANPLSDIARLSARMQRHALSGYVYDGSGHRHRSSMSDVALLDLIAAGDLNPALRALLPASVTSALRGDSAPLLRLSLLSQGLVPNLPGTPTAAANEGVDEALFVTTTCEEEPFPWSRTAAPATRVGEALSALHALPASAFYPFSASVEWADSVLPGCAHWPNLAPAPAPVSTLPDVPTLILSGSQDLRTPTSGAQALATRIPGASLLVVPFTGHSVLGSDFSGCAQKAVAAFFTAMPVQPCHVGVDPFAPTPVTPTRLAYVKPVGGVHGLPGSTLTVVLETILDLERQVVGATLQAEQQLPSGSSFGGLRGGYARITSTALRLHRLSFVPGVELTGSFPISKGKLRATDIRVEGSLAARGSVRIGGPLVTGTLAGRHFRLELAKVKIATADGAIAPPALLVERFPLPGLVGAR